MEVILIKSQARLTIRPRRPTQSTHVELNPRNVEKGRAGDQDQPARNAKTGKLAGYQDQPSKNPRQDKTQQDPMT